MLSFAAAYFFMVITPGPGVLTTAGVGAGYGFQAGLRYVAGLWLGNLLVGLLVASGIWAAMETLPGLRLVLGIASLGYLGWLAARIAFAGARVGFGATGGAPSFVNGATLQFINPKAYAVNVIFFSNFALIPDNLPLEIAVKVMLINLTWVPIHLIWLQAGVVLHRLDLQPRRQRMVNFAMAGSLLVVVMLAAFRV